MEAGRKALLLAAVFVLCTVFPSLPISGVRAEGEAVTLTPRCSEGVTITETSEGSMSVLAHVEGENLVFDEDKLISFTAVCGEGWLPCLRYSSFFPPEDNAEVEQQGESACVYTLLAERGASVSLEDWNSVAVNASAAELPKLYIDAEADFADIDRETWVTASYRLTLGSKQFSSGEYEGTGYVKGRGNSSWGYPKKPYSIKLDSKASLLDIPKTKKYAVIPGYYDGSLMRNFITYKTWQGLEGIGYVPKCELCEVYLNGEYNGIYTLVERIDIEKSKINIQEADAENMTGGYLIEKDVNGRVDFNDDLWFNCPYWANQSKDYFVMKAPEPDDTELAGAMLEYLEDYMQTLHDAVMGVSGEDYRNYVDSSSWVDFIIVQEIAKNIDGCMKTSCWMYKDREDDHLYMTAPWDFDFAYGRVSWNNQSEAHNDVVDCPNADTYDGFMIVNSSNPWMDRLYDTEPEFRNLLKERYTAYRRTLIDGFFPMIDEQAAYLAVAQQANYDLWGRSFHAGVTSLKTWLRGRLAWLDSQWLLDVNMYELGDVDMNGVVNSLDALAVLRASLSMIELNSAETELADFNGDGAVTASDALAILRFSMGFGNKSSE